MYPLGHLGIGLGIAWLISARANRAVDYRLVLVGAILPDLIDKPLAYALGLESRILAHSLLFLAVVLGISAIPSARRLALVALGVVTHLVLDRMWEAHWWPVILWPALGAGFRPDGVDLLGLFDVLLADPVVLGGEVVGLVVMVTFARAHGIRSWRTLRAFLRTGRSVGTGPAT